MTPISRRRRALRICAAVAFVLIAAVAISVPIQQRILRWRAERLLADIHALQMGKSTWADAQKLMHRWGVWGHYEGTCTKERCSYLIELEDLYGELPTFNSRPRTIWETTRDWKWPLRVYEFFGGRSATVFGRFEVIQGVVWGKDYVLALDANYKDGHDEWEYLLFGSADTVWRSQGFQLPPNPIHPEYEISRPSGCEGCETVRAHYTPFADPNEVNALLDFNLDCLTRRNPCRDPIDVMPSVWNRYVVQQDVVRKALDTGHDPRYGCTSSPEFLGRDQANVVVAQVESIHPHDRGSNSSDVSFHLIDRLKRAAFWKPDVTWTVNLPRDLIGNRVQKAASFTPGQKFILAFHSPYSGEMSNEMSKSLEFQPCQPIPLTDENLAAVRRGISRDIFPETREFWP
jgi:hypothetical protein